MTIPECVGDRLPVPLVTGERVPYANLDLAASAPAFRSVQRAVDDLLPWYSSVHRGAGFKSVVCTEAYETAREVVGRFFGARPDDAVLFTRNTTDSANLLASVLPARSRVVAFATEHHANLLPWRRHAATFLPPPRTVEEALSALEPALAGNRGVAGPTLVAVTGASNVTGELWPVEEIVRIAHAHGARVYLDAAQLAPHRRIDAAALDVDYLAVSGHKMYAPYGAGILLGRADWLRAGDPYLAGGGAVEFVTTSDVLWSDLPDRQEAGSPNVLGAVALAAACRTLEAADLEGLAAREHLLTQTLLDGLDAIPQIERYSMWGPDSRRIGVVPFNLAGYPYGLVAAILSAEYGVGVRHGCFCAHPLMLSLLRVDERTASELRSQMRSGRRPHVPGAVRASIGLVSSRDEVERFLEAVATIQRSGHRWEYRRLPGTDDYVPVRDPRRRPVAAGNAQPLLPHATEAAGLVTDGATAMSTR